MKSQVKKFPKSIRLQSRYSDVQNSLELVGDGQYKLITQENTVRVGFNYDPNVITNINPMGGPMLSIGDSVADGLIINKIFHSAKEHGFIIEVIWQTQEQEKESK